MLFLAAYFRQRRKVIYLFLLFCMVFACAFALYHIPVGAVLYPAAVCLVLYLLVAYNVLPYGWPESEWPLALRVLKTRFYDGLLLTNSMSAYGFVLFAGIKCLLPEKR